jgi:hypothetical protein
VVKVVTLYPESSVKPVDMNCSVDYGGVFEILAAVTSVSARPKHETIYLRK